MVQELQAPAPSKVFSCFPAQRAVQLSWQIIRRRRGKKSKICFAVDDDHQKIDNIKLFNLSTITMTINK